MLLPAIDRVNRFVAPSEFLANYFSQAGLIRSDRFVVIPNGVSGPQIEPRDRGRGATVNALYIGQLLDHKGINVLLTAAEILCNQDVMISIAGSGSLENKVRRSQYVDFLGSVRGETKSRAFRNADILVVPSQWYENNPLSILEGLRHGLAIVASSIGGIPELVGDRKNGRLIRPGSSDDLARVLSEMAGDRRTLLEYQQESLRRSEQYTKERMIKDYMDLYVQLVSSNDSGILQA